ncbi:hypothetical protein Tsubulata_004014 [Turnera subulata]|uniref:DUF4283 domain-containing protein n=1 Tax=Turnera subulata TaxID=218843 RepID=A0A9Q0JKX6_9ROSI|nr:hypothetical protein Tsubulata_004014 [Turnera subulata]
MVVIGTKGKGKASANSDPDILVFDIDPTNLPTTRFYLLAKLPGTKTFNPKAFTALLTNLWNVRKSIEFAPPDKSLFLITLASQKDVSRILKGEPWSFDKRLVLFKQVSGMEQFTQHIPIILAKVGRFLHLDERRTLGHGSYVQARVVINVQQALRQSISAKVVIVKYILIMILMMMVPLFNMGRGSVLPQPNPILLPTIPSDTLAHACNPTLLHPLLPHPHVLLPFPLGFKMLLSKQSLVPLFYTNLNLTYPLLLLPCRTLNYLVLPKPTYHRLLHQPKYLATIPGSPTANHSCL